MILCSAGTFANYFLEEQLDHMGVEEVRRSIYLTSYARHDLLSIRGDMASRRLAMPYLLQKIGGHGQKALVLLFIMQSRVLTASFS
ncbi:MAG: hypothetical protein ACQES4_09375 [Bacillota bacterium]